MYTGCFTNPSGFFAFYFSQQEIWTSTPRISCVRAWLMVAGQNKGTLICWLIPTRLLVTRWDSDSARAGRPRATYDRGCDGRTAFHCSIIASLSPNAFPEAADASVHNAPPESAREGEWPGALYHRAGPAGNARVTSELRRQSTPRRRRVICGGASIGFLPAAAASSASSLLACGSAHAHGGTRTISASRRLRIVRHHSLASESR